MITAENVQQALEALATLWTPDPTADDDTIDDWWRPLQHLPVDALGAAVAHWQRDHDRFPARAEFQRAVADEAAAIRRRAQEHVACPGCGLFPGGTRTRMVEVPDPDRPLLFTVRPCDVCEPELYARWAGGHWDPDHNRQACSDAGCSHGSRRQRGAP